MLKNTILLLLLVFVTSSPVAWSPAAYGQAPGPAGQVSFIKIASSDFDSHIENPNASEQQWMQAHFARILGWSPRFDEELHWFPNAWFYKDAYAIKPDWPIFSQHPEWVLRDTNGNRLYIPFACSGGSCPQYAGDFGNPAFRAWWIAEFQSIASEGYRGVWIDDVNLTWRVGDGSGEHVTPVDPRTGQLMLLEDWRRYMAEFMEQIAAALPDVKIAHNIIWYAGDRDNTDPYINREIDAADYINLERGVTDHGLTGGDGRYALTTFLEFIDFVHARGASVILMDEAETTTMRQYALAGWFAISSGDDLMSSENTDWTTPDNWWPGYDLNLGQALAPRFEWQNLIRRDFACGLILLNPPDRPAVSVQFGRAYTTIEGATVTSATLAGDHSIILLDDCAVTSRDADGDDVFDVADNCVEDANPAQRDSNNDAYGNVCDADLNDDCVVNAIDLGIMKARFFGSDADADLNGDGVVNAVDLGILKSRFFSAPGPSGLAGACAPG